MAKCLPWFSFYPDDYLHDTYDLTACEHGIYLLLLCRYWVSGPLKPDMRSLCRAAAGAKPRHVTAILERFWVLTDEGWVNERMQKEMVKSSERVSRAVNANKARWEKNPTETTTEPVQMESVTNSNRHTHIQEQEEEREEQRNKEEKPRRGSRLSPSETIPDAYLAFAKKERPDLDAHRIWATFCDYWVARPGQAGIKLDWLATWRNWIRKQNDFDRSKNHKTTRNASPSDRRKRYTAELARRAGLAP